MHATLRSTSPLPESWSEPEVVEDTIIADGVELRRAGMASRGPTGEEVTGAAAEPSESPTPRGYYELLERIAVIEAIGDRTKLHRLVDEAGALVGHVSTAELFPESDAPSTWRYAKSNGVAIHRDWQLATKHARWELAERDRLLRAWRGEVEPTRVELDFGACALGSAKHYQWAAYEFLEPPIEQKRFSRDVHTAAVFGFPTIDDAPLIVGFGARDTAAGAREAAIREATQSLAFLWGEPVAREAPPIGPTPLHHLEHFQFRPHQELLRRWLDGEHTKLRVEKSAACDGDVYFVDLTPSWLGSGLRVAKAVCASAMRLAFGLAPLTSHLPPSLRIHPIA